MTTLQERQKKLTRYAMLKGLIRKTPGARASERDFDAALSAAARNLGKRLGAVSVQVDIWSGKSLQSWHLKGGNEKTAACAGSAERPHLRLRMAPKDAIEVAAGRLSPARLYLEGRLLVVGDCHLARRLYALLADRGETEIH